MLSPSRVRARRFVGLVGLVGLVVIGAGVGLPAGAQQASPPTPFPRPLMAFVPVPAGGPADPALAVQTLAVGEGTGVGTGGDRRVTVGFASAFALPGADYRVSVVWGTPGGSQTRASLISTKGAVSGSVQTSIDGKAWDDAGTTNASFADDAVAIDAALGDAAAGSGLWVQAQVGSDPASEVSTAVYSADAALGRVTDGGLPATSWGTPAAPAGQAPVAFGTTAPTLAVVNQALVVTDPAPAPTKVAGQAVTSVVDEVTFLPGYTPSGTVSGAVQIDRTAGTIRAFTGTSGLPEDRTGSGTWVTSGLAPPPASSTSPMKVTLDLEGVSKALGVPLDANGTGLGLRRKVVLADGTAVVGLPVVGTVGWYQTAAVPTAAPPGTEALAASPVDPGGDPGSSSAPLIAGVVVAVALLVLAVVVAVVRRRRRVRSIEADLFGIDESEGTGVLEPEPEPEPEPQAVTESVPEPAPGPEPEADRPSAGGRSPAEVLAALDAHVEDLSARVERLGPVPRPDPEAPEHSGRGLPPITPPARDDDER